MLHLAVPSALLRLSNLCSYYSFATFNLLFCTCKAPYPLYSIFNAFSVHILHLCFNLLYLLPSITYAIHIRAIFYHILPYPKQFCVLTIQTAARLWSWFFVHDCLNHLIIIFLPIFQAHTHNIRRIFIC